MNTFICRILASGLIIAPLVVLFGNLSSQAQESKELMRPKDMSLKLDKELGIPAQRIGVGKLHQMDLTLVEIPPGGSLPPHKHFAEEMILVISGKGYTTMWNGKGSSKKERYDWSEGDLLSPPLNAWHQHFNASNTPARYITITTAPLTENVFKNTAFLAANDFTFDDRWRKAIAIKTPERFESATEGPNTVRFRSGPLFPDLRNRVLGNRGAGMLGVTVDPEGDMSGNELFEWELREFTGSDSTTPEHRHVWETVYFILKGAGYATLQQEGGAERRLDWKEGDMFLVEANEYHNHRPVSMGARFLQFKASGYFRRVGVDKWTMQNKPGTKVNLR
jgi:quercetin dioxygenase-like cupin family protein